MRVLTLIVCALMACDSFDRPVDPVWGKQPCGACAMLVSDPRTAAQLVTRDGERLYFDDIGCMVGSEKLKEAANVWVRDGSGRWIDARTAKYGRGSTPMDYGFVVAPSGFEFEAVQRAVNAQKEAR